MLYLTPKWSFSANFYNFKKLKVDLKTRYNHYSNLEFLFGIHNFLNQEQKNYFLGISITN